MNITISKTASNDMIRYFKQGVKKWGYGVAKSLHLLILYTLDQMNHTMLSPRYIGYRHYVRPKCTRAFYTYSLGSYNVTRQQLISYATSKGIPIYSNELVSLKQKPFVLVFAVDPTPKCNIANCNAVLRGVYYNRMDIEGRLQRKGVVIDRDNTDGYKVCACRRRNPWLRRTIETQLIHAKFCLENNKNVPLELRRSLRRNGYRVVEHRTITPYGQVEIKKFIVDKTGYEIY